MTSQPTTAACKPYVEAVTAVVAFGFSGSVVEAAVLRMASIAGLSDARAEVVARRAVAASVEA